MIKNQWYAILPSRKVKKNKITGVKRLNQKLALFRDSQGKLGCVLDQCSHRGAALSIGEVKDDCIQCPFHGIQFDAAGDCRYIPAEGKASMADKSRFHIKHWLVKEQYGIIYLWYGDASQALEDIPFFKEDIDESWVYSELEDLWHAHYSRCIENQLDVVHLPFVHRTTIGRGDKTIVNGPKTECFAEGLMTSADNEKDLGQLPRTEDDCRIRQIYLKFLFPNIWMNHISDAVKIMIYFAPVDDENTILYIRFYGKITGLRPIDMLIAWLGRFANKIVERQDKRVVVTQMPKASFLYSQENLIAGDGPIIQYRQMREERKRKEN